MNISKTVKEQPTYLSVHLLTVLNSVQNEHLWFADSSVGFSMYRYVQLKFLFILILPIILLSIKEAYYSQSIVPYSFSYAYERHFSVIRSFLVPNQVSFNLNPCLTHLQLRIRNSNTQLCNPLNHSRLRFLAIVSHNRKDEPVH